MRIVFETIMLLVLLISLCPPMWIRLRMGSRSFVLAGAFAILVSMPVYAQTTPTTPSNSSWISQLEPLVVQYVLPLVLTGMAGVTTWLGLALKNFIQAKVKNVRLAGILARLDDHLTAAVLEGEQAVRPTLESVAQNGKLSPADATKLKQQVLDTAKEHMGAAGLKELADILGLQDVASFLETRLEATVAKMGSQQDATAAKATASPPLPAAA